jgi:tetratricopeptide (TPR) repeat protein
MNTDRAFAALGAVLVLTCAGLASWLDCWFMGWQGNRAGTFNPLALAIGDGQKLFAGQVYRKADVYFHSGVYPSIFDNNESFKTAHLAEDAGATASKNRGDEGTFLGRPRDIIDRFSRNLFPSRHTHLDEGGARGPKKDQGAPGSADGPSGEVREILPWLKLSQALDPDEPLTYTVTAYWLRRMGKPREAELVLHEGLTYLPDQPALLFELGRIYLENRQDPRRARNVWRHAVRAWEKQEPGKAEPDVFMLEQIQTHLGKLEEDAGNWSLAITYFAQAKTNSPNPDALQKRIDGLRDKQLPADPQP